MERRINLAGNVAPTDARRQWLDRRLDAFRRVAEPPDTYRTVDPDTRRVLIRRFPFGVYFRVELAAIVAVAVMHGSRDPRRWKQRS